MFRNHLRDRISNLETLFYVYKNHSIDYDNEVVTFYLYNQSKQLVGFQQYKWKGSKKHSKDIKPCDMKYFTHCKDKIGVFGIDSWKHKDKPLVLVEGVFEQLRLQKHVDTVAVLCNNPRHIKSWLFAQPRETVAVCQNDKAGMILAKSCDRAIFLPEGVDTDELSDVQLTELLEEIMNDQSNNKCSE